MPTSAEVAYTAGLIDGEGCIRIQRNHGLTLVVGNTSLEMLEWLRDRWGGKIHFNRHNYANSKPFFQWQVHGKSAIAIIKEIRPYMVVKTKQADRAIAYESLIGIKNNYVPGFNEEMKRQRQVFYEDLKELNRRGLIQ